MTMAIEKYRLEDMVKGWFIGNFSPTLYDTNDVEVGVKHYSAGDIDANHYHKLATEFTVIINGMVVMNGIEYKDGDIIKVVPGVAVEFKALTDVTTFVIKIPGVINDKYSNG